MTQSWIDLDQHDLWTLTSEERSLLPGMTDKGRLAFSVQFKFMQAFGRFPERHDEVDPAALLWLAAQLGCSTEAFTTFDLDSGVWGVMEQKLQLSHSVI